MLREQTTLEHPGPSRPAAPADHWTGVVRRDQAQALSVVRLANGAEIELVGICGAATGQYPLGYLDDLRTTVTR